MTGSRRPDDIKTVAWPTPAGPHVDLLPTPIVHLLSLHPFTSLPPAVLPLLTSILHHYLSLIASTSARHATHCGRTTLNPYDVIHSINSIGAAGVGELTTWTTSEERADWLDRCEKGWSNTRAKEEEESRRMAWANQLGAGRLPVAEQQRIRMKYVNLPLEEAEEYEQLRIIEEGRRPSRKRKRRSDAASSPRPSSLSRFGSDAESDAVSESELSSSEDESASSPRTTRTTPSPALQLLPADGVTYVQRSLPSYSQQEHLGADQVWIDYIPHHLPPFPMANDPSSSQTQAAKIRTLPQGPATDGQSQAAVGLEAQTQAEVAPMLSSTAEGSTTTASYFKAATPFTPAEGMTSEQALASLPSAVSSKPARPSGSSLPSFIETYTALLSEPQVALPASSTRRSLAQSLANPSGYCPTDTLYGGMSAKPSSSPFVPSASHLITLPTRGAGAPRFTPTRPKGRPLSYLSDGVSTPLLAYRQPARVLSNLAQRLLASAPLPSYNPAAEAIDAVTGLPKSIDGSNYAPPLSMLHRSLHLFDPEPLRDREHVEQVFRGVAIGPSTTSDRDNPLLRGDHWLKGAVDAVKTLDTTTSGGAATVPGGDKVKSGTVVYTYDWSNSEYSGEVVGGHNYGKEEVNGTAPAV